MYHGEYNPVLPWLYVHVALGTVALIVAVLAMIRTRAPRHPLIWLRVNFVILLIAIFIVAVARQLRLIIADTAMRNPPPPATQPLLDEWQFTDTAAPNPSLPTATQP